MANNNETTTKFKVDISELKKAMQEAKRQVALANSEFKAASSSMDDWSKSSDGISAKLKQLDSNLSSQKRVLAEYEKTLAEVKAQYGENSKEAQEYQIKLNNQQAVVNQTEKQIKQYAEALDKAKEAEEIAARTGRDAAEVFDELGRSAESSSDGFTVLKGALASLVADGIRAASAALKDLVTDSAEAYAQFSASTGIATEAMGEYEDAIKSIYKNNFGESLADVAEKMARVKEVTGELDASKLQDMTEKAITLEDVFGMDMTETLRGVRSLMTHFGISAEEAFDYLASGAQNGLNYTDELGDNVAEYAGKFAEAGYTTRDYFQLLQNASQGGSYNLDKVNDSINEITTRLADGTIEDALDSYDEDVQFYFDLWKKGEATQKEVIDEIVRNITETTGEQEKMNLAAKAFGTMAEDGGTKFIESLDALGTSYNDVTGKAEELANIKYDTPAAAISGIGRTLKVDLLQPIVDKLMPYLNDLADWVTENLPAFKEKVKELADKANELLPAIVGIASAITTLTIIGKISALMTTLSGVMATAAAAGGGLTGVLTALNLAFLANPITWVVAAIVGLVAAFVILWKRSDEFRNFWIGLWDGIKETTANIVGAIGDFFTVTIPEAIDSLKEKFSQWRDDMIEHWELVKMEWSEKIQNIIDAVVDFFNHLPERIGYALGYALGTIVKWALDVWNFITVKIPEIIASIVKFFSELPAKVWTWLVNTIAKIISWSSDMKAKAIEAARGFIDNVITFIKELPSKVWTWLVATITKLNQWREDMGQKGKEAITELIDKVIEGAKEIPEKMMNIGKNIVDGVWQGIQNAKDQFFANVKGFFSGLVDGAKDALGIHSPSKIFAKEVGKWIPAGIGVGIEANADSALKSMKNLSADLVGTARLGLSSSSGSLSGGSAVSGGVVNNFTQINNSPKALSRLEIYRQSKNLLGYAGGV